MNLRIHIDGGARGNPGPAAAAIVIADDDTGAILREQAFHLGKTTNNVAEYQGLLRALNAALELKAKSVRIHSDSELMVRQITGQYRVKSPDLIPLYEQAQAHLLKLDNWQIRHVYREDNRRADELVNQALDRNGDVTPAPAPGSAPVPGSTASEKSSASSPVAAPSVTPASARAALPPFDLEVVSDPTPADACPGHCSAGHHYPFAATLPQGVCTNLAAAALRQDIAAMKRKGLRHIEITCPLCSAKARITGK
jgi:ribonuclease HI